MHHVQQTEIGECQLCCVAMLTGFTKEEVRAAVELHHDSDDNVSFLPDCETAYFLQRKGFTFGLRLGCGDSKVP